MINYNRKNVENNIYIYNWITLLCSRNQYNIVNQLYFSKKLKKEKLSRNRAKYLCRGRIRAGTSRNVVWCLIFAESWWRLGTGTWWSLCQGGKRPYSEWSVESFHLMGLKNMHTAIWDSQVAQWERICLLGRRHVFDIRIGKSWRRKWQPTPVSLPGKSHG